jgi:hypothetical protein
MHRFALLLPLLLATLAPAADKPVPPVGSIIHDLRDLMPELEKKTDQPDAGIPAYSVKTGFWTGYASYDLDHDGLLSQKELAAVIADLKATLREHYPDTFAAMDTDGDDQITYAEFKAYQAGKH